MTATSLILRRAHRDHYYNVLCDGTIVGVICREVNVVTADCWTWCHNDEVGLLPKGIATSREAAMAAFRAAWDRRQAESK